MLKLANLILVLQFLFQQCLLIHYARRSKKTPFENKLSIYSKSSIVGLISYRKNFPVIEILIWNYKNLSIQGVLVKKSQ